MSAPSQRPAIASPLSHPIAPPLFDDTRSPRQPGPANAEFPRKTGPSLSYELLRYSERWMPRAAFKVLMRIGTWVALIVMPRERRNSRRYLSTVFGRPAKLMEVWNHFFAFTEMFVLRARVAEGRAHQCQPLPSC
ncbi:MAG: hypothetical protein ABIZ04_26465, partial [Opitutus sp.]